MASSFLPRSLALLALLGTIVALVPDGEAKDWPKRVPSEADRGKELYARHCVACHGEGAAGDGPLSASLVAPVPDLSEGWDARPIEPLVDAVLVGTGSMPGFSRAFEELYPWGGDFRDPARDVLKHMKSIAGSEAPPPSSKAVTDAELTQAERDEEAEAARD